MRCTHCDHGMVELNVEGPYKITMQSCVGCGRRVWTLDGEVTPLPKILRAVSEWSAGRRAVGVSGGAQTPPQ